mmetsp:Transcript_24829/g.46372  ORF Transcript_24829/g.46372 Transcript_24829/m.46372 type:complete len:346 (-) Transcript_24829:177-1214(-)
MKTSSPRSSSGHPPSFLPHEHKGIMFLTDSGAETTFIFKDNLELREFAAFELHNSDKGRQHLKEYYRRHLDLAVPENEQGTDSEDQRLGFVLETCTWRANPDWMIKLGYKPADAIHQVCASAVNLLRDIQMEYPSIPMAISGQIGPRSDGYVADQKMSVQEAQDYHYAQIKAFHEAGADLVAALTMNYVNEGIGIVQAAQKVGIPVVLSFTVEVNGCIPTGESIQTAIEQVDATTNRGPAYYMINCAHPSHFILAFQTGTDVSSLSWKERIGGIRGNASKLSHAELDEATELDEGNPVEFGKEHMALMQLLPRVNVFGGCCGTDDRHVREIKSSCWAAFGKARSQ